MGASVWVHGCTCMGILSTMACPVSGCQQYARKLKLVKSKDRVLLCKPVKGVLVIPLAQFLAFVIVNLINYMGYESLCLFPGILIWKTQSDVFPRFYMAFLVKLSV